MFGTVTASFFNAVAPATTFSLSSLTNVGLGETVTGAQSASVPATIAAGSNSVSVPITAQVGLGGVLVVGSGIPPNTTITNIAFGLANDTLTLSQNATSTGTTSVVFDTKNCFAANTFVTATTNGVIPTVSVTPVNAVTCSDVGNGLPLAFNTSGFFPAGTRSSTSMAISIPSP